MNCNQFPVLYQKRYCSQEVDYVVFKFTFNRYGVHDNKFSFLKVEKDVLSNPKNIQPVSNDELFIKASFCDYLYSKGVVLENFPNNYSHTNRWSNVCLFMKKIYLFSNNGVRFYKYHFKVKKWHEIARLNKSRLHGLAWIFKGKIIVSGGFSGTKFRGDSKTINSVEAYDHYENKWTCLPDMIEWRANHSCVSIGNKLFVTAGYNDSIYEDFESYKNTWEVFVSIKKKFTLIGCECEVENLAISKYSACCFGDKVVLLNVCSDNTYQYIMYDTKNKTFSSKLFLWLW